MAPRFAVPPLAGAELEAVELVGGALVARHVLPESAEARYVYTQQH